MKTPQGHYPAQVYADRGLSRKVGKNAKVGWICEEDKPMTVILINGLWLAPAFVQPGLLDVIFGSLQRP